MTDRDYEGLPPETNDGRIVLGAWLLQQSWEADLAADDTAGEGYAYERGRADAFRAAFRAVVPPSRLSDRGRERTFGGRGVTTKPEPQGLEEAQAEVERLRHGLSRVAYRFGLALGRCDREEDIETIIEHADAALDPSPRSSA